MVQLTGNATLLKVADAVRRACIQAALDGHEQAGLAGLCAEGRWEMAIDAMRSLDVAAVVRDLARSEPGP